MIGLTIAKLLKNNANLLALVSTNSIYPRIANENTKLPYIVYTVDSLNPEYNKDGWTDDSVGFSVNSFSGSYTELQAITLQVRKSLELLTDTNVKRIYVTGYEEAHDSTGTVFGSNMRFKTDVNKY